MTVEVAREVLSASVSPTRARPVAFDGLFGWLHPGVTRRGVVLCGTLGFEQLSAYRAWRALAEDIAGAGCPCLRFDYPGEGDSADGNAGSLTGLVGAIRNAMGFLRAEADVAEIVLVGLRLGGMLAVLAAQEGGVDRIVLLAPFASGRAYLREMHLQARTTVIWPGGIPLRPAPGTLNVHGFVLDQHLMAEIGGLQNALYGGGIDCDCLIIESKAPARPLIDKASKPGSQPRMIYDTFAGFSDLLSGAMNFKPVSDVLTAFDPLTRRVRDFVADGDRLEDARPAAGHTPVRLSGCGWVEEPVFFGEGLFGIIGKPDGIPVGPCSVLFVNSGTYVRSGSGRHTTRLARRLAARGVTSFRIDLGGTGDSADCRSERSPIYNLEALADISAAIDRLRRSSDAPVMVVGFCSGAYLGFQAVCSDDRVTDAVLTNLYCFDWPSDTPLEEVIGRPIARGATTYAKSLMTFNTWRRLATGRISVAAIASTLLARWIASVRGRWAASQNRPTSQARVVDRMSRVHRRGGRVTLVYSAEDPGLLQIQSELGMPLEKIERSLRCRIKTIDDCDHNLSAPEAQARLEAIIFEALDRRSTELSSRKPTPA